MKILIDTHVLLWMSRGVKEFSQHARTVTSDSSNKMLLSVASAWEVAIKHGNGRIQLHVPYRTFIDEAIGIGGMVLLPISVDHLERVGTLPLHHRDPFDRLLVAQALVEGIPIVSADSALDAYGVERIW